MDTELSVVQITTDEPNEARDLFIRLQGGLPLTPQEKRDAWPGSFTDYILRVGGKEGLVGYGGHPFFRVVMRVRDNDRGKARQLAAQMAMLFLTRHEEDRDKFVDVSSGSIDDFYYNHLNFDRDSPHAKRFDDVLTKLTQLLGSGNRPRVRAHEAIHVMLLVDDLWDDYTRGWEADLAGAFDQFNHRLDAGARANKDPDIDQTYLRYWQRYGQWARTNSDQADRIMARHLFYTDEMMRYLNPMPKDPRRGFNDTERRAIYARDRAACAVCRASVQWDEAEVHHVVEHSRGGTTTLDNGVLVHSHCHPKGGAALRFAEQFQQHRDAQE